MADEHYPEDLIYHPEHDWAKVEGDIATFGITWFAQDALGEVVFFEPPAVGTAVTKDASYAEIESVKAVSEVVAPLSGEIVEVNGALESAPETINDDPYGSGWMVKIKLSDPSEVAALLDPAAYKALLSGYDAIEAATKSYEDDKNNYSAISPFSSKASDQISKDKTIAYIAVTSKLSASEMSLRAGAEQFLDVAETSTRRTWHQVSVGSYAGDKLSKPSSRTSEVVGLIAAVIILLLTFGALVAMTMPIITAIFGLGVGLSVLTLVSTVSDVPTSAPALATMIGLGVGIDYGLFIVTQHRHLLAAGHDPPEAAARATATAGGAVVFAGSTVIIALLSLLVAGIPLVSTLGYTSAIVVLLAVLAAITLLPALLSLVGHHIHFGTLPWHDIAKENPKEGAWHTWAEAVTGKPWIAIGASVAVLVVLSIPMFSMTLGQTDDGSAATGHADARVLRRAHHRLRPRHQRPAADRGRPVQAGRERSVQARRHQVAGAAARAGPRSHRRAATAATAALEQQQKFYESKSSDPRLQQLRDDLEKVDDVKSVSQPSVNDSGSAAVYQVISDSAPSDEATADLVTDLRDDRPPEGHQGQGHDRLRRRIDRRLHRPRRADLDRKLPLVIAVVLIVSFFLLMLAFRSVLVPIEGRGDEPAVDRRGVRRRDLRVHARLVARSWSGLKGRCRSSRSCR